MRTPQIDELLISELWPLERYADHDSVAYHLNILRNGGELKPIRVMIVDDKHVVTDGSSRGFAAKQFERTTIQGFIVPTKLDQELRLYRDAIQEAIKYQQVGFENMPLGTEDGRMNSDPMRRN